MGNYPSWRHVDKTLRCLEQNQRCSHKLEGPKKQESDNDSSYGPLRFDINSSHVNWIVCVLPLALQFKASVPLFRIPSSQVQY